MCRQPDDYPRLGYSYPTSNARDVQPSRTRHVVDNKGALKLLTMLQDDELEGPYHTRTFHIHTHTHRIIWPQCGLPQCYYHCATLTWFHLDIPPKLIFPIRDAAENNARS